MDSATGASGFTAAGISGSWQGYISSSGIVSSSQQIQNYDDFLLNTTDTLTGDLTVTGTITAQEFHTEFVSASIIFESGSTIEFQDTSNNAQVTVNPIAGHITASGNISASGYISASHAIFPNLPSGVTNYSVFYDDSTGELKYEFAPNYFTPGGISGSWQGQNFISASQTFLLTGQRSGDSAITGSFEVTRHITASGNISASGNIFADQYNIGPSGHKIEENITNDLFIKNVVNGKFTRFTGEDSGGTTNIGATIDYSESSITLGAPTTPFNVTASANISASGLLFASSSEGNYSDVVVQDLTTGRFYTTASSAVGTTDTFKTTGQRNGDSSITGSLVLSGSGTTLLTVDGNISASGTGSFGLIDVRIPTTTGDLINLTAGNRTYGFASHENVGAQPGINITRKLSSSEITLINITGEGGSGSLTVGGDSINAGGGKAVPFSIHPNVVDHDKASMVIFGRNLGLSMGVTQKSPDYSTIEAFLSTGTHTGNLPTSAISFRIGIGSGSRKATVTGDGKLIVSQSIIAGSHIQATSYVTANELISTGNITASGNISASGTLHAGLTSAQPANIAYYDTVTGLFTYGLATGASGFTAAGISGSWQGENFISASQVITNLIGSAVFSSAVTGSWYNFSQSITTIVKGNIQDISDNAQNISSNTLAIASLPTAASISGSFLLNTTDTLTGNLTVTNDITASGNITASNLDIKQD